LIANAAAAAKRENSMWTRIQVYGLLILSFLLAIFGLAMIAFRENAGPHASLTAVVGVFAFLIGSILLQLMQRLERLERNTGSRSGG
jgi:uncharacterized protein YybS (DUF2232 family)